MKAFRLFVIAAALACASVAFAQAPRNSFSVVLLLGDTQGIASLDNLPSAPGIRKALNDVKDFLPYKSYRVLDTQWLRSGMTRMNGAEGQEYEVSIEAGEFMRMNGGMMPFDPASGKPAVLVVSFHLQEAGAAMSSSEEFGRSVPAADMERRLQKLKAQLATSQSDEMKKKVGDDIAQAEKQLRMLRAKKLLDSRFEMAPGETVVVGTSKIGGADKALVVLLTAVPGGK
jgi:hypothetical protein